MPATATVSDGAVRLDLAMEHSGGTVLRAATGVIPRPARTYGPHTTHGGSDLLKNQLLKEPYKVVSIETFLYINHFP